jgi:hypothetical protein
VTTGTVDIGSIFADGVVDTVDELPSLSLTPVLHLEWQMYKGLVACCHSFYFIYFYINRVDIQCLYIYTTRRVPYCCPRGFRSVEGLLWGAESRFELWPALQQADALLYEPRRTH